MAAEQPKIVAYMKPVCGWSQGVRAVLGKYGLDYEDKDIVNDPYNYAEMVRLTGQYLQPSLQVGDEIIADVSGEEVEAYLLDKGIVQSMETVATAVQRGCEE